MRLRNVFHAFALGILLQTAAAAQPLINGAGETNEGGRSLWGLDLEALGEYVGGAPPVMPPAPLNVSEESLTDVESYMDVYRILREENSCSRFFGGPAFSLQAFNDFARRLRKKPVGDGGVAIRMSGAYTIYRNNMTGATFRIFDDIAINSNGPFFIRIAPSQKVRMHVGRFPIPSKAARALTLLHELGHLLRGADGQWLLPNDGGDKLLSVRNTREVEGRCLDQLMALKD
jgi:hypothetical protein